VRKIPEITLQVLLSAAFLLNAQYPWQSCFADLRKQLTPVGRAELAERDRLS